MIRAPCTALTASQPGAVIIAGIDTIGEVRLCGLLFYITRSSDALHGSWSQRKLVV